MWNTITLATEFSDITNPEDLTRVIARVLLASLFALAILSLLLRLERRNLISGR